MPLEGIEQRILPWIAPITKLPGDVGQLAIQHVHHLWVAPVVVTGNQIDFLDRQTMDALGGTDQVHRVARQNLMQMPEPEIGHPLLATPGDPSSGIWALQTHDVFGAARLTLLPTLIGLITTNIPHGAFVAAPTWWLVLLHILRGKGAMAALKGMAQMAASEYERVSERARLNNYVYWMDPALSISQVVASDGPDGIEITTHGPVATALFGPNGVLEGASG